MVLAPSHSLNSALASESAHAPEGMKTCSEYYEFNWIGQSTRHMVPKQIIVIDLQLCMRSEALE